MTLTRHTASSGLVFYASPKLTAAGVPHAFSTRLGGVSGPPFDSLNFGSPSATSVRDRPEHLAENHARLMGAIGLAAGRRHWTTQVHAAAVVDVDAAGFVDGCDADALVTRTPGRVLSVRSADCCPVLIATADGRTVAAVHAGWRGAVGGVATAAVAAVCSAAGVSADVLIAAVGPCISVDAFEVGPEVLSAFAAEFGDSVVRRQQGTAKGVADLPAALVQSLTRAGVKSEAIDRSDRCTVRDATEFFSHRRDHGVTGRMVALIAPAST